MIKENIEVIVIEYEKYIYKVLRKYLNNIHDIEDVAQETILKVMMNIHSFKNKSKISTWIYIIAKNCALDFIRRNNRVTEITEKMLTIDENEDGESDEIQELKLGIIEAILKILSVKEQEAYLLAEVFNIDSIKGSEILNITAEAFRKRVSRAKEKLDDFRYENCEIANNKCGYICNYNAKTNENIETLKYMEELLELKNRIKDNSASELRRLINFEEKMSH